MNTNAKTIIEKIDKLQEIYLRCKVKVPYLRDEDLGKKVYISSIRQYKEEISFEKPIDKETIDIYWDCTNWVNENAIIRLYGIMDNFEMIGKNRDIDENLNGEKELKYLQRLRNFFAHKEVNPNPNDINDPNLKQEVINHFELNTNDFKEDIEVPTPVDKVVLPLFNACRLYVAEKLNQANVDARE